MPDGIKDALLIYNPTSGGKRHRRFTEVEQAARILKEAGIATELLPPRPAPRPRRWRGKPSNSAAEW